MAIKNFKSKLGYFSLQASWDDSTQTVVMHRGAAQPSLLQSLIGTAIS